MTRACVSFPKLMKLELNVWGKAVILLLRLRNQTHLYDLKSEWLVEARRLIPSINVFLTKLVAKIGSFVAAFTVMRVLFCVVSASRTRPNLEDNCVWKVIRFTLLKVGNHVLRFIIFIAPLRRTKTVLVCFFTLQRCSLLEWQPYVTLLKQFRRFW